MFNKENLSKLKQKLIETKNFWITASIVLILLFAFCGFYIALNKNSYVEPPRQIYAVDKKQPIVNEDKPVMVRRFIDGVYVEKGSENFAPFALVIDNLVSARPQLGLSKANLVIEAEAEGNITRYLAFFAVPEKIEKIGPVRSARPYFVDWSRELGALFGHVGGSPEALTKIRKENILDINEYYNGHYFWRDPSKAAPHNVYTSSELMNEFLADSNLTEGQFFAWQFKDDLPEDQRGTASSTINVDYKLSNYSVEWAYDRKNNNYTRSLGGNPHKDGAEPIAAKNIIIQFIPAWEIDDDLRLAMVYTGAGEGIACQDGFCRKINWHKETEAARTKFAEAETNNEIKFNAGPTWIEVVRPDYEVVY